MYYVQGVKIFTGCQNFSDRTYRVSKVVGQNSMVMEDAGLPQSDSLFSQSDSNGRTRTQWKLAYASKSKEAEEWRMKYEELLVEKAAKRRRTTQAVYEVGKKKDSGGLP